MAEARPRYEFDPKAPPKPAGATGGTGPTVFAEPAPEPEVVVAPEAVEPEAE